MFRFDRNNPSKIVATNLIESIVPNHRSTPMIWTPNLQPFYSRRVFIICTINNKNRSVLRFYPLKKRNDLPPPSFVVVDNDNKYVNDPTTHVVLDHEDFKIIRPIKAVFYKSKWSLMRRQIDYIPVNLLTLIKHCYFKDLIDDEFLEQCQKEFEKIEKILLRAKSTNFEAEAEVCLNKSIEICNKIFTKIKSILDL